MSAISFDKERASSHEKRFSRLAPIRETLHLFTRMIFSELPTESQILCVGAGTGPELFYLAEAFPDWRFTAVDPSPEMLNICREKADKLGIGERCTFHEGYLDSLTDSGEFHAATCFLVSQFVLQPEKRIDLFRQIFQRIKPGGLMVSADLSSDMPGQIYQNLLTVWARTMEFSSAPKEDIEKLGHDVAVLPSREIESFIQQAGFEQPVLFFQALLIHAWFSRKTTQDQTR